MRNILQNIVLLISIYLVVPPFILHSQDKVNIIYKEFTPVDTLFSIRSENLKKESGFYFPALYSIDSIFYDGINPLKKLKIDIPGVEGKRFQGWHKIFDYPLRFDLDKFTSFYLRLYSENILEYTIYLYSVTDSCWYQNRSKITYDKYQEPLLLYPEQWTNVLNEDKRLVCKERKSSEISQLVLHIKPCSKKFRLYVGDLNIYNMEEQSKPYHDPLFESLNNVNSFDYCKHNSLSQFSNSPIILSCYNIYNSGSNEFFIENEDLSKNKLKEIKTKMVHSLLDHYPFYKERGISKNDIQKKFTRISALEEDMFEDSLRILIQQFHDPHFFIEKENKKQNQLSYTNPKKLIDPLRAYEINGDFYIAAVFDTTLNNKVFIGDKVISIDGNSIGRTIDKYQDKFLGMQTARRQKSISRLLKGCQGDTTIIELVRDLHDTVQHELIYNSEAVKIPSNFKPQHCEFKFYNDIAYFRVNLFMKDAWLRFLNHANEIVQSKGIIFDIRNNGGGDLITVLNIFSTFIKDPSIVLNYESPVIELFKETVVVKPNETFHFDIPVIILINKGTVCGSELFAYLMKKYDNAILVGDSNTGGSFSERISIVFPDSTKIYTNAHAKMYCYPDYLVECKGINPDIWVSKNKIADLYPFEDKVLKTAIRVIEM